MKAYFAAQPWDGGRPAIDFVRDAADEMPGGSLRIAVAWSNFRGLTTLTDTFDTIRSRGGRVDLITGLSSGGATQEGLARALEVCDDVHVAFDSSGPTFHPKVYLYTAEAERRLLVGSSNLTIGGLYRNTEAGLELRSEDPAELEPFDAVSAWMDALIADPAFTLPLTTERLPQLIADPRLRIPLESEYLAVKKASATSPVSDSPLPSLFSSSERKRYYPKGRPSLPLPSAVAAKLQALNELDENAVVLQTWSKQLKNSDAQVVTNPNSNPTGNLRLAQAKWPIDHKVWFRNLFFGDLGWADVGGIPPKESCVVPFQTMVDGEDLGVVNIGIDHAPARVANQGNVSTILHWGSLVGPLRATNHYDSWVVLKSWSDGHFSLEIKTSPEADELPPV